MAVELCPDCGARWPDGKTCDEAFGELIAREYVDPVAGTVHHLTVPTFMLQHHRYSDAYVTSAVDLLHQFLVEGRTPADVRQATRASVDSGNRTYKITGGTDRYRAVAWPVTVMDVPIEGEGTEYTERVTAWARATLDAIRQFES